MILLSTWKRWMPDMTQKEVLKRVRGLKGGQRRSVICSLIGHSRVIETRLGYIHCARCKAQIGDTLMGSFDGEQAVIVDHDCKTCRKNAKALDWNDLIALPAKVKRGIPSHA